MYFGPLRITWSNLENTHPPIWLPVFIQRDSPGGAVGGGIPVRRSSVEIISSFYQYCVETVKKACEIKWKYDMSWCPPNPSALKPLRTQLRWLGNHLTYINLGGTSRSVGAMGTITQTLTLLESYVIAKMTARCAFVVQYWYRYNPAIKVRSSVVNKGARPTSSLPQISPCSPGSRWMTFGLYEERRCWANCSHN